MQFPQWSSPPGPKSLLHETPRYRILGQCMQGKLKLQVQIFRQGKWAGQAVVARQYGKLVLLGKSQELRHQFTYIGALRDFLKGEGNVRVGGQGQEEGEGEIVVRLIRNGKQIGAISLPEIEIVDKNLSDDEQEEEEGQKQCIIKQPNSHHQTSNHHKPKRTNLVNSQYHKNSYNHNQDNQLAEKDNEEDGAGLRLERVQAKLAHLEVQLKNKDAVINKLIKQVQELQKSANIIINHHHATNSDLKANSDPKNAQQKTSPIIPTSPSSKLIPQPTPQPQNPTPPQPSSKPSSSPPAPSQLVQECYSLRSIEIRDRNIRSTRESPSALFLPRHPAPSQEVSIQAIQISKQMGLGLVDSRYRHSPDILSKPNLILLTTRVRLLFLGKCTSKPELGVRVRQGDVMEMRVEWASGRVEWVFAGNAMLTIEGCDKIGATDGGDGEDYWVPCIVMFGKGDVLDILATHS